MMTDAELAILSIVAEGPIYGHAVQTVIDERGLRAWTNIGVSSMYYVLEKLEQQGLLESITPTASTGPARRQYQITTAGYGVLQTSVADLLSTPRENSNGFELGLANMHVLTPSQIRSAFTAYHQELEMRLHNTRTRSADLPTHHAPFNVEAMFERTIALLEAELAWLTIFVDTWELQAPPDPPPASIEHTNIPRMKQVVLPHDPDSPHRAPTRPLNRPAGHPHIDSEAQTDMLSQSSLAAKDTTLNASTPMKITVQDDDQKTGAQTNIVNNETIKNTPLTNDNNGATDTL